jgi:hypothetical protein
MPDARFKSEWLFRSTWVRLMSFEKLSFHAALAWCVAEGNDGVINHDDLDLIPDFDKDAIPVLVTFKHLKETRTGWQMVPFGKPWHHSQSTAKQVENYRAGNRIRSARARAKKAGKDGDSDGEK